MFFTDQIRRVFGMINVEVITGNRTYPKIRISGVRGDLLQKDLSYYYKTTRVANYMFDQIGRSYVIFPAFFALEFVQIMDDIINTKRPYYVSRNTAKQLKEAVIEGTWLKDTLDTEYPTRLNLGKLSKFKKQPLDFQSRWLSSFDEICYRYKLNGAILDAVMGSGKTMMGLYVSECAPVDVKIIVSPKNALHNVWEKTLNEDLTYQPKMWLSDSGEPYKGQEYILCHYEALSALLPIVQSIAKNGKKMSIVVDECHNFNEMKSARTQTLIAVCKATASEYIILQSGTPFKAIGAEIVPALFCIDPAFNDNIAERFKKLYAASAEEALQLLKRRLGMISFKVVKEEVGLGKPIIEDFKVSSPNADMYTLESVAAEMQRFLTERNAYYQARKVDDERLYMQIVNDFRDAHAKSGPERAEFESYMSDVRFIRRGDLKAAKDHIVRANAYERNTIMPKLVGEELKLFKEIKTIYKYVVLKIQGECLGRILGRKRMECSVEISRSIDYDKYIQSTTKKSLIFTMYVQALEAALEVLREKDYKPVSVYGATNHALTATIKDFDKDPAINPLVATFMSLSTAVPLTMANLMIMIDTPFRSHTLQQTIARIERLGQKEQTYVYIASLDTGSEPNMSTRTLDILKWSQSQIEKITGVTPPFVLEETSVSLESYARAGRELPSNFFIDLNLEEKFMENIE